MAPALAARRASDVLRHLARHPEQQLTLSELATALSVAPAALHGVVTALTESGLIDREDDGKRYRLGPEAVLLGTAARLQNPAYAHAGRVADEVAERLGVATTAVARRGETLVALDGSGGRWAITEVGLGTYRDLAAPVGTCFLAGAAHHEVLAWLTRGGIPPETAEAEGLRAELDLVAERGWAVDRVDDRTVDVLVSVAVPVPDGLPEIAVGCFVPAGSSLDPDEVGRLLVERVRGTTELVRAG